MKDTQRAAPWVGINEGSVGRLYAGTQLSRIKPRHHVWGLIVKFGCVVDGLRSKITLKVFWTTKGHVDHNCVSITDSGLDTVFCNCIMMVATKSAVFDTLNIRENFVHKLLRGVHVIVSTVPLNGNAQSCSFLIRLEFGLNSFSSSKSLLMKKSNLTAGCVI